MSSAFNGHVPPEIIPDSASISWDEPRPKCSFVLTNKSAWPIVYKIKVQHKILGWSEAQPAQGIVRTGSSCVISLKLELRAMRENGLASKSGHKIHVESWYISHEDALRSDPAKLLSAIKRKVENPRKPDTSVFQIRYTSPTGQDTLLSIPQTPHQLPALRSMSVPQSFQLPAPRSMSVPQSFQPASEPIPSTPSINTIPPSRQQTLAFLMKADSPALLTSASQPTTTHERIARYISEARVPISRRSPSSPLPFNTIPTFFPDIAEEKWMPYIPVNQLMLGRVKVPEESSLKGFCDVHQCEVRFATSAKTNPRTVAVKVLRQVDVSQHDEADVFQRMVGRLTSAVSAWSTISHPNIVPILGFTVTPLVSVISPWFEKGNLHNYLNQEPDTDPLKLLLDIAKGLAYLHSQTPEVVHGDLKINNILITNEDDAVLSDFGLSRIMEENPQWTPPHQQAGSVRWMAPEILLHKGRESCKADVWSFGMIVFEAMTGKLPSSDLDASEMWSATCDPNNPKDPVEDWDKYPELPEPIKEMMVRCWSRRPEKRPSMRHVEEGLARLLEARNKGADLVPNLETLQLIS